MNSAVERPTASLRRSSSPLFEEEWDSGFGTLVSNVFDLSPPRPALPRFRTHLPL